MYTVWIGKYINQKESAKDNKKLVSMGITPYLFKNNDVYSFKVFVTPNKEKALVMKQNLNNRGFQAYTDV